MALPKLNRLKKEKDFQGVFKKGRGLKQNFLFLKVLKNGLNFSRFGFIITKKTSKKASVRNKLKRKLSEAIRARLPKIKKGWDGIFVISPLPSSQKFREIDKTAEQLLEKAKLTLDE